MQGKIKVRKIFDLAENRLSLQLIVLYFISPVKMSGRCVDCVERQF